MDEGTPGALPLFGGRRVCFWRVLGRLEGSSMRI